MLTNVLALAGNRTGQILSCLKQDGVVRLERRALTVSLQYASVTVSLQCATVALKLNRSGSALQVAK